MTDSNQILNNLYELKDSMPQNPVTKLDEVNTILHIYAFKEEIRNTTDEKHKEECQKVIIELEKHYQELQRKKPTLNSMSLNVNLVE